MVAPGEISEAQALDDFLSDRRVAPGPISFLAAAMEDARVARAANALWLSALGHLVCVELIADTVAPKSRAGSRPTADEDLFVRAWTDFDPKAVSKSDAKVLYRVRCALAHSFSIRNSIKQEIFVYTAEGPLVVVPKVKWDGTPETMRNVEHMTRVNLAEVCDRVTALVEKVRHLHQKGPGEVVLLEGLDPLKAESVLTFMIGSSCQRDELGELPDDDDR